LGKIGTQENCDQRKELAAAGIRTTRCAKIARGREQGLQRQGHNDNAPRTRKRRNDGKRLWRGLECNSDLRSRELSQQLREKTGIKDPRTSQQLRLGKERTTSMIYRKAIRLEIVK
jgi:hypothetical protein